MKQNLIGVTLLGCGTVGSGVIKILTEERQWLRQRTGLDLRLLHAVGRTAGRNVEGMAVTTDANAAIDDTEVDIVVELMGGTSDAYTHVKRALSLGKSVVTANKALLASKGKELFCLAREKNACIGFEASAAGGIPIIDALQRGLIANRITALVGIVNGTCNFILSKMSQNGWSYEQALKEAQAQGFAEADPTMDVSGKDSLQKLIILAGLAFNVSIDEADIHLEGIDSLDAADIKFADELGYTVKLLAIAEKVQGQEKELCLRVHPALVGKGDLLAQVSGSFNAISMYGHALGHAFFYGRGAGKMPTASAVVADIVSVATGTTQQQFRQLNVSMDQTAPAVIMAFDKIKSRYYLRLMVKNAFEAAPVISALLEKHAIIASNVSRPGPNDAQELIPIVMITDIASEGAMQKAVRQINQLLWMAKPAVCLRIFDHPEEFA